MIYSLHGTVQRLDIPQVVVTVGGVGYIVTVTAPFYETLSEGEAKTLVIYTLVREDRLDLFGFKSNDDRALFVALMNIAGIGPKSAMELCSVPRNVLFAAASQKDATTLSSIKGIGKKTAEKLLVDLGQLLERHPEWAMMQSDKKISGAARRDDEEVEALLSLGYDRKTALSALKNIPENLTKTEDRLAAALRSI